MIGVLTSSDKATGRDYGKPLCATNAGFPAGLIAHPGRRSGTHPCAGTRALAKRRQPQPARRLLSRRAIRGGLRAVGDRKPPRACRKRNPLSLMIFSICRNTSSAKSSTAVWSPPPWPARRHTRKGFRGSPAGWDCRESTRTTQFVLHRSRDVDRRGQ